MVVDALAGLKDDLTGRYYSLTQMTDKEQQQLIDVSDAGLWLYGRCCTLLRCTTFDFLFLFTRGIVWGERISNVSISFDNSLFFRFHKNEFPAVLLKERPIS